MPDVPLLLDNGCQIMLFPVYPPDHTCLLCGKEILILSDVNFHVIMDGADKTQLELNRNTVLIPEGQMVLGIFHSICYDAGLTFEYKRFGEVLIEARNNLFRGDF